MQPGPQGAVHFYSLELGVELGRGAGLGWKKLWTGPQDSGGVSLTVDCGGPLKTHCILPCPSETGMCQVPMWLCLTLDHALSTEVHHLLCPRKGTLNDNLEGNPGGGGLRRSRPGRWCHLGANTFLPRTSSGSLSHTACVRALSPIFSRGIRRKW